MTTVIVQTWDDGGVNVLNQPEGVDVCIINMDRLEEYTAIFNGVEVEIDEIDEIAETAKLILEDGSYVTIPLEELQLSEMEDTSYYEDL